MTEREQRMTLFEKACATWGFDFTKDVTSPHGTVYASYETGVMFGMFDVGFDTGREVGAEEAILKERG